MSDSHRPFLLGGRQYPARSAVPCHQIIEVVLDIKAFRPGCLNLADFATDGTPEQMVEWTTQRVMLETVLMALVAPSVQVPCLPHGMIPSDVRSARKKSDDDDAEDDGTEDGGSGNKKRKGHDGEATSSTLRFRMAPKLTHDCTFSGGIAKNVQNVHVFFEWLVSDMSILMSDLLKRENIVGVRLVVMVVDKNMDFAKNLARLVLQNHENAVRHQARCGEATREIVYQTYDPAKKLATGYEKLTHPNDLLKLLGSYAGYKPHRCPSMDFDSFVKEIDLFFLGRTPATEKLKALGVCREQHSLLMGPMDTEHKIYQEHYREHADTYLGQMPVPACAVEIPVESKRLGPDLLNNELPFVTLLHYLNKLRDDVAVVDVRDELLTPRVTMDIEQQAIGVRHSSNAAQLHANEHIFKAKQRAFAPRRLAVGRLNDTARLHLERQLMNEAKMAFSTQQVLPQSMIEGLRQTEQLVTMVVHVKRIASNLSTLGNHVASQMMNVSKVFNIANNSFVLVHMSWSALDQFSDRLELRNHHILIGDPGTSKSFFLKTLQKLLPPGFAVDETYSSVGADNVTNLLESSHICKFHDEMSPWMTMGRDKVPMAERQRMQGQLTTMTNGTRSIRRNVQLSDPTTGRKTYLQEKTTGEVPEIHFAASNFGITDPAMADRFIVHHLRSHSSKFALHDYMGADRTPEDEENERKLRDFFHKKYLAMMHVHKMHTIGLPVPRPNTALVRFYARKMFDRFTKAHSNSSTSVSRPFEKVLNTYSTIMYDYAWRMTFGSDVRSLAQNDPFAIEQLLRMTPYLVICCEEAAIIATTAHMHELLAPELSVVANRTAEWCCGMSPVLFAEWVRYADYAYAAEHEMERLREEKTHLYYGGGSARPPNELLRSRQPEYVPFAERTSVARDEEDLDAFCSHPKMGVLAFQSPDKDQMDVDGYREPFVVGNGRKYLWHEIVCAQFGSTDHPKDCPVCHPISRQIPKPPTAGFLANIMPPQQHPVKFFEEMKMTNLNYMELRTVNIKSLGDIAKYLSTCQSDRPGGGGGGSEVSPIRLSEADYQRYINVLSHTMLNVPWVELQRDACTDYMVALQFSPAMLARHQVRAQPVLRVEKDRVYILTAIALMDFSRLRHAFLTKDISHKHTRERRVVLGAGMPAAPSLVETHDLKCSPHRTLTADNPAFTTEAIAAGMACNGLTAPRVAETTEVNGDVELFFSREMVRRYGIDVDEYSPESVEWRMKRVDANEPPRHIYPDDFLKPK